MFVGELSNDLQLAIEVWNQCKKTLNQSHQVVSLLLVAQCWYCRTVQSTCQWVPWALGQWSRATQCHSWIPRFGWQGMTVSHVVWHHAKTLLFRFKKAVINLVWQKWLAIIMSRATITIGPCDSVREYDMNVGYGSCAYLWVILVFVYWLHPQLTCAKQ